MTVYLKGIGAHVDFKEEHVEEVIVGKQWIKCKYEKGFYGSVVATEHRKDEVEIERVEA